ncbi:lytic transglycosylase domain-containing protein [Rhizobium tumorigenes]|uniref:Lytic transglycosylase domain-containing protein n=1 Tax=Rhizobium tumorigenes TaxID=2041385 RepID=A0AAF1KL91_9HYPH|nr:lytic transglycosylase domain-containing protein [Rhizobium tumorigenes]WFR97806.1 lytic transglycosylase domain-containing protein [Rhizobium tumorigenes]
MRIALPMLFLPVLIASYAGATPTESAFSADFKGFIWASPRLNGSLARGRAALSQETNQDAAEFRINQNGVAVASEGSQPASSKGYIFGHFRHSRSVDPELASGQISKTIAQQRSDQVSSSFEPRKDGSVCGPSRFSPDEIAGLVARSAMRYGVDPDFAEAIAWTESRFNRQRNSPKGARGPMQLVPETAARFDVADICDPIANIDGGMRYLRSLIDRFGNPLLAAAAYNAGEGRIYEHNGIPPYGETVRYVAEVVNYQLGLSGPTKSLVINTTPRQRPAQASSSDVGTSRAAKFVSGVMQF